MPVFARFIREVLNIRALAYLLNAKLSWWNTWLFAMLMVLAMLPAAIIHFVWGQQAPSVTWLCYGTLMLQFTIGTWFLRHNASDLMGSPLALGRAMFIALAARVGVSRILFTLAVIAVLAGVKLGQLFGSLNLL